MSRRRRRPHNNSEMPPVSIDELLYCKETGEGWFPVIDTYDYAWEALDNLCRFEESVLGTEGTKPDAWIEEHASIPKGVKGRRFHISSPYRGAYEILKESSIYITPTQLSFGRERYLRHHHKPTNEVVEQVGGRWRAEDNRPRMYSQELGSYVYAECDEDGRPVEELKFEACFDVAAPLRSILLGH